MLKHNIHTIPTILTIPTHLTYTSMNIVVHSKLVEIWRGGQRRLFATCDPQFSLPTSSISHIFGASSYHVKFIYPKLELVCHEEKLQTAQVR